MKPWLAARRVQMIASLTTLIDERTYLVYGLHNETNWPRRRIVCACTYASRMRESASARATGGVLIVPGQIAFTRISSAA